MRNIKLPDNRKRKLARLYEQFTVTEVVGRSACRLNTPVGIHNVFHNMLIRPTANDPFPSQRQDDVQPDPIDVDGHNEWALLEILDDRVKRGRGRGGPLKREFLCRWEGYAELS
ncbi:hypothetical protein P152DRAFT_453293 [Eremomyces bilateralis CBS 781.70]|uniref:Chromo domain-containing protein n=1 Tax=Eremomyces bilateralis CBS 781.70 TaxID=1392243 RepID=A0A6G1FQD8_9PEZI|nr:uncharacterized protein P152DRAFT_453293 [Eremomyces bilateralis CBS 781.70]KAF1807920.1 hypothetical protein P152DRAFT_453293 [Eremomyces bilateralis CBS 781.70]